MSSMSSDSNDLIFACGRGADLDVDVLVDDPKEDDEFVVLQERDQQLERDRCHAEVIFVGFVHLRQFVLLDVLCVRDDC